MFHPLTDAMVIDDGFFSDINDILHSHAMPEPGYVNPDMSNFGELLAELQPIIKYPIIHSI